MTLIEGWVVELSWNNEARVRSWKQWFDSNRESWKVRLKKKLSLTWEIDSEGPSDPFRFASSISIAYLFENLNNHKNIYHQHDPNLDLLKPTRVLCTISWQIDRFIKRKIGDTKHKVSRLKATQTITTADFSLARNGRINEKKLLPAFFFYFRGLDWWVEWSGMEKEEIVYLKNDFVRSIVGCYGVHITMETLGEWERETKMWKSVVAMTVWLSFFLSLFGTRLSTVNVCRGKTKDIWK